MPFDLDQVLAEAKPASRKKKFAFTFDGIEYTLPNELDQIALELANSFEFVAALKKLLTARQWEQISQSTTVLTQDGMYALFTEYYKHLAGLSAGNSEASSPSSRSTARPSKRTSKRTTGSRSRR